MYYVYIIVSYLYNIVYISFFFIWETYHRKESCAHNVIYS